MLLLGVGDAAERRAEVDPDPVRVGARRRSPGVEPGVVERQPAGDQPELAEPVELAGGLGRHPGERVEVVDLGRDLRAERRRVEPVDALDRRARRAQAGTERVDARCRSAVTMPMPVIQTPASVAHVVSVRRRRSVGLALAASASASALNVASVAAGDRPREAAVDERARTRAAGARSRARS